MTDFRSVEDLLVFCDGDHVADLRRTPKGCLFQYTSAFLASPRPQIALQLPKTSEGLRVEGLANLPTYFAGMLPEGIMFAAVKRLIGSAADDLFAVLAATGADAIGDIDVRVPHEPPRTPSLNLAAASELIRTLLESGSNVSTDHLSAIAGVQPKLSLGEIVYATRRATYIAKFPSPDYPDLLSNEHAFMRLARRCHLDVSETRLAPNALIVKRFDREFSQQTGRMEKVHTEDMLQAMDLYPNSKYSLEYQVLMRAVQALGVSKATLLDALRLYVFSYVVGNGDLHAKNVSLLYGKHDGQWRLSPAYDLLSTLPYGDKLPGADRMALPLADESYGRFSSREIVDFGLRFGLPEKAVFAMIHRTVRAVAKFAPSLLHGVVSDQIIQTILDRAESLAIGRKEG